MQVAINNFTIHLIISNGLEYKNADRREKLRHREVEAKEEIVNENLFIHLIRNR